LTKIGFDQIMLSCKQLRKTLIFQQVFGFAHQNDQESLWSSETDIEWTAIEATSTSWGYNGFKEPWIINDDQQWCLWLLCQFNLTRNLVVADMRVFLITQIRVFLNFLHESISGQLIDCDWTSTMILLIFGLFSELFRNGFNLPPN
jgi:hypothetical protein